MGHNIKRYISQIWDKQQFVFRQGSFYSNLVDVDRGCTQWNTDSPIIFKIIVDAVIRKWKSIEEYKISRSFFYVDDGLLKNED